MLQHQAKALSENHRRSRNIRISGMFLNLTCAPEKCSILCDQFGQLRKDLDTKGVKRNENQAYPRKLGLSELFLGVTSRTKIWNKRRFRGGVRS